MLFYFIDLRLPLSSEASGESTGQNQRLALNNYQQELSECFAFYGAYAEGIRRSGDEDLARKVSDVASLAAKMAYAIGNSIGMTKQAMLARIKLSVELVGRQMNNDYANFSVLLVQYKDLCRKVLQDPEARIQYWEYQTQ